MDGDKSFPSRRITSTSGRDSIGYLRKLLFRVLRLETRDCATHTIIAISATELHAERKVTEGSIGMKLRTV